MTLLFYFHKPTRKSEESPQSTRRTTLQQPRRRFKTIRSTAGARKGTFSRPACVQKFPHIYHFQGANSLDKVYLSIFLLSCISCFYFFSYKLIAISVKKTVHRV